MPLPFHWYKWPPISSSSMKIYPCPICDIDYYTKVLMISFDRITALVMARSCECSFCYFQWTGFDMVTSFPSYINIERIIIGYNFENNTWTIPYYVVSITSIVQNKNINCLMFASKTAWWYNWIQLNSCRNWHDWASSWC